MTVELFLAVTDGTVIYRYIGLIIDKIPQQIGTSLFYFNNEYLLRH